MIQIAGISTDINTIASQYPPASVERKILNMLSSSSELYTYASINELKFELGLRRSIIGAARELHGRRLSFAIFDDSRCNPAYWIRTEAGGFMVRGGVRPSDAVKDIYVNTYRYATECSTAIVIVYYKALVDVFPETLFNNMFSTIHLMNWRYLDDDIGIRLYRNQKVYLPGDCRYFKNPDVNPLAPEWQGENAIDLGDGTFYGHGIGIRPAAGIIDALNRRRVPGSQISAYLMDSATRPNFTHLARRYYSYTEPASLGSIS